MVRCGRERWLNRTAIGRMLGAVASGERPFRAATILPKPWSSMSAMTKVTSQRMARKARVAKGASMIIIPV